MTQNFPDWYTIEVTGVDTQKYLQGQLPINLLKLSNYRSIFSFLSVPTGKVLGIYRLVKITDEKIILLCYQKDNCDKILNHLKKFAVFSKVTITCNPAFVKATSSFELLKSFNAKKEEISEYDDQALKFADLSTDVEVVINKGVEIYKIVSGCTNLYLANNDFEVNYDNYEEILDLDQFLSINLLSGYNYLIKDSISNQYLPQAFGIDNKLESSISYTKGCYQGQEGIAKAKYRGTNPYICFNFVLNTNELLNENLSLNDVNSDNVSLEVCLEDNKFKTTGNIFNLILLDNSQKIYQGLSVANFITISAILSKKLLPTEYDYYLVIDNKKFKLTLV